MVTDLAMYLLVRFATIAQKHLELQFEIYKVVKTTTAMVGRTNTVNGMRLSQSWAKIQLHLG